MPAMFGWLTGQDAIGAQPRRVRRRGLAVIAGPLAAIRAWFVDRPNHDNGCQCRFTLTASGFILLLALTAGPAGAQPDGAAVYARACAQCHEANDPGVRAPKRDTMRALTPDAILRTLETGPMQPLAKDLSPAERLAVSEHIAGRRVGLAEGASQPVGRCDTVPSRPLTISGPHWNGWGADLANTRFQPAASAGLSAADVGRLRLKWAFGMPGVYVSSASPSVVDGVVFMGGNDKKVHALDARTGCLRWEFAADAAIRAAITIAPRPGGSGLAAYFGDLSANAYAVDAATGALLWRVKVDDHPAARISGTPVVHDGSVYVPIASVEEGTGAKGDYECCTFRGSLVALDAATGALRWKSYTIAETPKPAGKSPLGTQLYGPSGAAIWSAPTIDPRRGAIYVATGNAYSRPAADTSDAVIAFDLKTGRERWHRQMTPQDAYIVGCLSNRTPNCPEDHGPDHDFGQSPILTETPGGRAILVIAQKSGVAHALDPDDAGAILWQTRLGKGGALGGSEWGSAVEGGRMYVAISDVRFLRGTPLTLNPAEGGGLFGLDLATGHVAWSVPPVPCGAREKCSPALSAAVTAIPGVVFSGGVSGFLRAYSTLDQSLLWEVDTTRDYSAVNGVPARGGAIDGPGPVVVNGMLYTTSGYGRWGGRPGNVLLAYGLE